MLFAHALLVHSGGINSSGGVRIAVINDFQRLRPRATLMWQVGRPRGRGGEPAFKRPLHMPLVILYNKKQHK